VSHPPPTRKSPILCYVTDRRQLRAWPEQCPALVDKIIEAASAGVDWIQLREKDLSGAELTELAREILAKIDPSCRIIINDRLDVAWAVAAAGVHQGEKSIFIKDVKKFVRERRPSMEFLIGASVHSQEAAQAAEQDGADYVIFGPVFPTPSKASLGAPQGLERLATICRTIQIPVLAVGGVSEQNAHDCYAHGASGIAAIRLFQQADALSNLVPRLRARH
jgi:thiamine-phosphate pyrophosphorylase